MDNNIENDNGGDSIGNQLELEKKKIQYEFNMQRAKMKELFLQKEAELHRKTDENIDLKQQVDKLKREVDDIKSQLTIDSITLESNFEVEKRKANEEIASLQRVVHDTVEESSSTRILYDNELRRLEYYIKQLQDENADLKTQKQQSPHHQPQEHSSLAPSVVLNALTKGIAKKLGAESFTSQDENSQKLQEESDVFRTLVEPLEDQIKALKEKLRSTDEQLQKCRECGHHDDQTDNIEYKPLIETDSDSCNSDSDRARASESSDNGSWIICDDFQRSSPHGLLSTAATNTSFEGTGKTTAPPCDMCSNYEAQLVREQQRAAELADKAARAEKTAERHKEELSKEIGFRKEMEEKWNEKKEQHKQQVAELTRSTECTEQDLKELKDFYDLTVADLRHSIAQLGKEREQIYEEITKLQEDNDYFIGRYSVHSEILEREAINLPDTVEELHELILRKHQELITEKIGKETAESKLNTLQSEHVLLQSQIESERGVWKGLEGNLLQENSQLKKHRKTLDKELEKLRESEVTSKAKIDELNERMAELKATTKNMENQTNELKTRAHSLQKELDTTETVQKDFVRLSQSLQMQLEKIRESDTAVRWQHEEDVDECPTCRSGFSGSKRKLHCRHCGQIFCVPCLSRAVPSGPSQRPSKVCDVCYTLLVKSSAPYFSEAPPPMT